MISLAWYPAVLDAHDTNARVGKLLKSPPGYVHVVHVATAPSPRVGHDAKGENDLGKEGLGKGEGGHRDYVSMWTTGCSVLKLTR